MREWESTITHLYPQAGEAGQPSAEGSTKHIRHAPITAFLGSPPDYRPDVELVATSLLPD